MAYRIYCITEGKHVIGHGAPTESCPTDGAHTVKIGSLAILIGRAGGSKFRVVKNYNANDASSSGQRIRKAYRDISQMSVFVPPGKYRVSFTGTVSLKKKKSQITYDIFTGSDANNTEGSSSSDELTDGTISTDEIITVTNPLGETISIKAKGSKGKILFTSGSLIVEEVQ